MAKDKNTEVTKDKAQEDAEAAKVAEAAAAAAASANPPAPALQETPEAPAAPAPRVVGDIPVTCLKTETWCVLGNRRYQLIKGQEILMDPSHADELEAGGWIAKVEVVTSGS